jgi:hypothetical protein
MLGGRLFGGLGRVRPSSRRRKEQIYAQDHPAQRVNSRCRIRAALIAGLAGADEPKSATGKPGKNREGPITFTIKNVVIEEVDEANATLSARYGKKEKPSKLVNLPVSKQVRVVGSHVFPSVANNLSFVGDNLHFRCERLKELKGKQVSLKLRVEDNELSVDSVSASND